MLDYKQLIEQDCREYRELLRMREEITADQSSRLDTTAIKARFPELVQQFMKITTCKRFTIT